MVRFHPAPPITQNQAVRETRVDNEVAALMETHFGTVASSGANRRFGTESAVVALTISRYQALPTSLSALEQQDVNI